MVMSLPGELLDILVCPVTRSRLRQHNDELIAQVGGLRYPIRDGIPVLLADEAKMPEGVASMAQFRDRFASQIPQ